MGLRSLPSRVSVSKDIPFLMGVWGVQYLLLTITCSTCSMEIAAVKQKKTAQDDGKPLSVRSV